MRIGGGLVLSLVKSSVLRLYGDQDGPMSDYSSPLTGYRTSSARVCG